MEVQLRLLSVLRGNQPKEIGISPPVTHFHWHSIDRGGAVSHVGCVDANGILHMLEEPRDGLVYRTGPQPSMRVLADPEGLIRRLRDD